MSQVANAKAIMGAAFIQYLVYGVIYVMESTRYSEFYDNDAKEPNAPAQA